ncbi:MAG: DUF885 family protein [Candidatus Aminicenantes bacterium]|nr:DUF885 family protein [Candidatus Aminicenantes bacterium]
MAKSTGNFRTGESHLRTLRMTTQGTLPIIEEVMARSTADLKNIRNAMAEICIPYFKIMYPKINPDQLATQKGNDYAITYVIQGVLDKLKVDHVGREEYLGRLNTAAASIKGFIEKQGLINLPEEPLAIEPMPAYFADGLLTRLVTPGAFETGGAYTLYVRPIPAAWSAEDATSFLEEYNNFYVDFMVVQRIFPGSFVPSYFARKDPSIIKRVAANQGLLEGWPVYLVERFVENGYGNFDLRMRIYQLNLLLKTVVDFQTDLSVHEGTWTKDKAIEYMTGKGFMTKAEAERRWNRIVLNPGKAAQPYIGYQEILDLEKDYRKLKGEAFNTKDFLQKLLSYGAIPLRTLKVKMVQ